MRIKEIHIRWAGIPLLAALIVFILDEHKIPFWENYLHSLLFTGVFWNGGFMIFCRFRNIFPGINQTAKRLLFTVISLISFLIVFDFLICYFINQAPITELIESGRLFKYMPMNFTMSLILGSVYENVYYFENWKKAFQVNEKLKNEQIRTQFEVLQNQMSPHFLFNSLNTLTTLISENQNTAIDFTQKLSDVYRYILQQKERELVPLQEEIAFAKDYYYLLKIRYPNNLHVNFEISDTCLHYMIAPLTLQMLIENAIKHNVVSKAHPLTIKIWTEYDTIVVSNNLRKKTIIEKSTKTGLSNIKRRYELLDNMRIDINETAEQYTVTIPLIQTSDHPFTRIIRGVNIEMR